MARQVMTVEMVSDKVKAHPKRSGLPKTALTDVIAREEAYEVEKETNELFRRGSGILPKSKKKAITVSKEIKRDNRTRFTMKGGKLDVSSSMESTSPDVKQKYEVLANMYFRIVSRTPYDEDYFYTVPNPNGNGRKYYYRTNEKGKRYAVPYTPYVREHIADDIVAMNEWKLTINNDDGTSVSFLPTDFSVNYEHTTNKTAYLTIAKALMSANKGTEGVRNFFSSSITNDNPYIDVLEFGKYSKHDVSERRRGAKRFHGSHNGYSVQAPRGMVRITIAEFQEAEEAAKSEDRQVKVSDVQFNMTVPDDADEILRDAMSKVTGFVDEKDILDAIIRKKKAIPLSNKTLQEIREHYKRDAKRRMQKADKEAFEKLRKEVEAEEKEEAKWEYDQAKKNHKKLPYRKEKKAKKDDREMTVEINTPKQHEVVKPIRKTHAQLIEEYAEESMMRPVRVSITIEGFKMPAKFEGGKLYVNQVGHSYTPFVEYMKSIYGRVSEKKLQSVVDTILKE